MHRSVAAHRMGAVPVLIGLFLSLSPLAGPAIGGIVSTGALDDSGDYELRNPWGLATDELGNIYVADSGNHRVVKFSPTGQPLLRFGSFGSEPGQFYGPTGIAYGDNEVYVADTINHRIQVFSTDGFFLRTFGTQGGGEGQLGYPTGITFAINQVWVTEGGANCRVSTFSPAGSFKGMFGSCGLGNGQFYSPGGIAVVGSDVFVADQGSPRVQRFNLFGAYESTIGSYGEGDGQFHNPDGIVAIEGDNPVVDRRIFVVDAGPNSRVQEFTADGAYVSQFGGSIGSHFAFPHGLAMTADGDRLYVSDTGGTADVWEFRDLEPKLVTLPSESSKRVIQTEGVWIELLYNQLEKSCNALAKATLSIPGRPKFTVEDDFKVTNVRKTNKVDLSDQQAKWFKRAINKNKKVPAHWKVIAKCSDNVRLTKEYDFKFR